MKVRLLFVLIGLSIMAYWLVVTVPMLSPGSSIRGVSTYHPLRGWCTLGVALIVGAGFIVRRRWAVVAYIIISTPMVLDFFAWIRSGALGLVGMICYYLIIASPIILSAVFWRQLRW